MSITSFASPLVADRVMGVSLSGPELPVALPVEPVLPVPVPLLPVPVGDPLAVVQMPVFGSQFWPLPAPPVL
jgi:hypothetical protein